MITTKKRRKPARVLKVWFTFRSLLFSEHRNIKKPFHSKFSKGFELKSKFSLEFLEPLE